MTGPHQAWTANAEGDSAQNRVAPPVYETFQEQTYQRLSKAIREGRFSRGRR
jgi:hypothetical protein